MGELLHWLVGIVVLSGDTFVEQSAQTIDPMIGVSADRATPNKQCARIFKAVGD